MKAGTGFDQETLERLVGVLERREQPGREVVREEPS
jgi:hypothetical protein